MTCYNYAVQFIERSNRWSGDNGTDAATESPWCWDAGAKHDVKWTAEGAEEQGFSRSIPQRIACVRGKGCVSIRWGYGMLFSDRTRKARWHRGFGIAFADSSLAEEIFCTRAVFISEDKAMLLLTKRWWRWRINHQLRINDIWNIWSIMIEIPFYIC